MIRAHQVAIERERRLPRSLVEQLRDAGLYRMVIPHELGGAEVDTLTLLHAIELVAEGDGAAAWNLATNAMIGFFAIGLPDAGIRDIFGAGPDVIFSGTVASRGGTARVVDGGYLVSGRWRFGSGCREGEWMAGACEVLAGDEPRLYPDGTPELRRCFLPAAQCTILDTWNVTGLQGTGSHDWTVTETFVPEHRTQHAAAHWGGRPGTLYAMPRNSFGGPHFSAVATGIARTAIDSLTELAGAKVPRGSTSLLRENPQVHESVGRAEALLESARAYRNGVIGEIWDAVALGTEIPPQQELRCRLAASYATENALRAVDLMHEAGGTTSIERDHPLARCWRDAHVVGQNVNVGKEFYGMFGRAFLGVAATTRKGEQ